MARQGGRGGAAKTGSGKSATGDARPARKATRRGASSRRRAASGGFSSMVPTLLRGGLVISVVFIAGLGAGFWLGEGHGPDQAPRLEETARSERASVSTKHDAAPARPPVERAAPAKAARAGAAEAPKLTPDLGAATPPAVAARSGAPSRDVAGTKSTAAAPVATVSPPFPADSSMPAWKRNAVAVSVPAGRPMVAIVIDDMGIDRRRSELAARLPGPLTLSYLAYASDLRAQTQAGSALGHELMVHVPMQPSGDADPGPGALLVGESREAIEDRLGKILGNFEGYVGINNHMGSLFTADDSGMRVVLETLKGRGLLFLDSLTSAASTARRIGGEIGTAVVARDVFLDDVDSQEEVIFRLEQAERIARDKGSAIALGHPRDATLDVLARGLEEAPRRGIAIVPVSAVAAARLSSGPIEAALVTGQ
jgi:polysaccharide deacetylase 2 family uncharacterized protein YibQ